MLSICTVQNAVESRTGQPDQPETPTMSIATTHLQMFVLCATAAIEFGLFLLLSLSTEVRAGIRD